MAGHDVMWLQRDLTKLGISTHVTSRFNLVTKWHLQSFQRKYQLTPDGVFGPETYADLLHALLGGPPPTAKTTSVGSDGTNTSGAPAVGQGAATQPLPVGDSGGAGFVPPPSDAPVVTATIDSQGLASDTGAPQVIQEVIAAANAIAFKPYIYGGGHASFQSSGYDCSGSVSYALHGAGLLKSPLDSTEFETYGQPGPGRWITIYANGGHAYMDIAGIWFDTAAQSYSNSNDRWSATRISPASEGWTVVHPTGW